MAFNDGVLSFPTIPGKAGYGGADLAGLNVMLAIDSAVLLDADGNSWTLRCVPIADLEAVRDQAQPGPGR